MNSNDPNLKYKLKAVILDFKFDRLTQDELIEMLSTLTSVGAMEKFDSVLIGGIIKAISFINENGLTARSEQSNSSIKIGWGWTYSN
jgi:hypothetical protein